MRAETDPDPERVDATSMGRSALIAGAAAMTAGLVLSHSEDASAYLAHDWEFAVETYGAVGDGTTDDTSAIQDTLNAAATYASANNGFARVLFKDKTYKVAGAIQTGSGAKGQLLLPSGNVVIELVGAGSGLVTSIASGYTTGTMLRSTSTSGYSGSGAVPALLSAVDNGSGAVSGCVVIVRDLAIRLEGNPTLGALNFQYAAKAIVDRVAIDTVISSGQVVEPTHPAAVAITLPQANNHATITVRDCVIAGFSCGIKGGEHAEIIGTCVYRCKVGLAMHGGDSHLMNVRQFSAEHCPYVLAGHSPTGGAAAIPTGSYLKLAGLDIEDANDALGPTDWANPVNHINDPNNALRAEVAYLRQRFNIPGATTGMTVSGASHVSLSDINGH